MSASERAAPRFAIALGSGAAKGYAHLGVLEVLEEAGLRPEIVTGASVGALVGGAAVAWGRLSEVIRRFRVTLEDPFLMDIGLERLREPSEASIWNLFARRLRQGWTLAQALVRDSLFDEEKYMRVLRQLLPLTEIERLERRFACVSTNLTRADRTLWTQGDLLQAVGASCAIPGVFPAIRVGEELHVDGGWVEPVPVVAARQLGATFVVAVELAEPARGVQEEALSGFDILLEANRVTRRMLQRSQLAQASVVLRPAVEAYHWADFQRFDELVQLGREVAERHVDEIRRLWETHRRKGTRRWFDLGGRS